MKCHEMYGYICMYQCVYECVYIYRKKYVCIVFMHGMDVCMCVCVCIIYVTHPLVSCKNET